jgi:hypothetical protein
MLWSGLRNVPALGFWGVLVLGAALGAVGLRCLRGARPRVIGLMTLGLAILIPISVRAVPFTFTNGTAADATQVNANFAAVTPVTGFFITQVTGPFSTNTDVLTPTFVAPRALTCVVHLDTQEIIASSTPSGNAAITAIKFENGVVGFATAPPLNDEFGAGMVKSVNGSNNWVTSQARLFSVASGSTVQFGCRATLFGDFAAATDNLLCSTVYECF